MPGKRIDVVVLNYNGRQYIEKCLESLLSQTADGIEILVLDNGSTDDSLNFTRKKFPGVKVEEIGRNLGFSRGHNLGISMTDGEFYSTLNTDVELEPDFYEKLREALLEDSDCGAVTGKLYQLNKYAREDKILYTTGHLLQRDYTTVNRGINEYDRGQYETRGEVFGVNGAAPLYRRKMLEDIRTGKKYLDSSLFMYGADLDVDWRMRTMGWKCAYCPEAVGYHHGGRDANFKVFKIRLQAYVQRYLILTKYLNAEDVIDNIYPLMRSEFLRLLFMVRHDKKVLATLPFCLLYYLPHGLIERRLIRMRRRIASDYIRKWAGLTKG
ncbi:MAG: glycosyltransferase family 2 protein [Deltaproteobacteria bacterium]|nr:glycosyltransferase family 2 protein [Deltaproteobacteria bacterium]